MDVLSLFPVSSLSLPPLPLLDSLTTVKRAISLVRYGHLGPAHIGGVRKLSHVITPTNGVDFLITAAVLYALRVNHYVINCKIS